MDAIDNPDHGASTFNGDGIKVVTRPYVPSKALNDSAVSPAGGPVFPAMEDVQISSTPT